MLRQRVPLGGFVDLLANVADRKLLSGRKRYLRHGDVIEIAARASIFASLAPRERLHSFAGTIAPGAPGSFQETFHEFVPALRGLHSRSDLTRLGESGCDAWTLARVAGHSSVAISSRYVHPSEDAVLAAISRLGGHSSGHNAENVISEAMIGNAVNTAVPEGCMVSAAGLEPATHALKGHCSTN